MLGAALELIGFVFTAREIVSEQRRVEGYRRRPATIRLNTATETNTAFGVGVVTGGASPPIEDRVASLEKALQAEQEERRATERKLSNSLRERISSAVADAMETQREEHAALAKAALPLAQRWGLWLPVALFAAGVGLSTAGSLLQ